MVQHKGAAGFDQEGFGSITFIIMDHSSCSRISASGPFWPIGQGPHTSPVLAEVLKVVKASGLPYQLTPTSTCLEGGITEVLDVIRRCHEAVRAKAPHFVVCVRLEEDGGETGKLLKNVASVEIEAGEKLATEPPESAPRSSPRGFSPTVGTYVVTGTAAGAST